MRQLRQLLPRGQRPYLEKLTLFCTQAELGGEPEQRLCPVVEGSHTRFVVRWNGRSPSMTWRTRSGAGGGNGLRDPAVAHAYPYLMYR